MSADAPVLEVVDGTIYNLPSPRAAVATPTGFMRRLFDAGAFAVDERASVAPSPGHETYFTASLTLSIILSVVCLTFPTVWSS